MPSPLKTLLIGCGRMGSGQAKIAHAHADLELVAVCDVFEPNVQKVATELGIKAYTDPKAALAAEQPEVVIICTGNDTHAPLTFLAAETPSVRGVYCEKPMATNLADARRMVAVCEARGIVLVVNHQRRMQNDFVQLRRLIEAGAIGELKWIRTNNQGDLLSDGTHAIDCALWLAGDADAAWVAGSLSRNPAPADKPDSLQRFGHVVETGARGIIQLQSHVRLEINTGEHVEECRAYQDIVVYGSKGTLWRSGDLTRPNAFIQDAQGGTWDLGIDVWMYKPVPNADGARGSWRPVEGAEPDAGIPIAYARFAAAIREGVPHPMSGRNSLRGFEMLMGIYESARLHRDLHFPITQERFPLEVMIEEGKA